jgi:phosphoesterase RecJ-like protein
MLGMNQPESLRAKDAPHRQDPPRVPDASRLRGMLHDAQRILLVSHVSPDGDAIGSLLGLGALLQAQGKDLTLACEDPVPEVYCYLPGSERVVRQATGAYDLVISLDCSDERRMGTVFDPAATSAPLINIDHHVTNTYFGDLNWVDPSSVATTQMILSLADEIGWQITQPVALCLLTGLVTDTRSFRTSNVDVPAMEAALRLMARGATLSEITRRALDQRPLASIRLWGQAIDGLILEDGILWTEVTRSMRRRWALGENGDSGLANFLSGVREANVIIVFTERENGTVDVGMRSVPGYDVASPALRLGGGGHPQAAGCTLEGDLARVRDLVLAEVRHSLAGQSGLDS